MIISGTLAIIATTATIFGLVSSGANVAGTIHDKNMINESLQNMHETQQLLQEKARNATGQKQQEMLVAADKLGQVNQRMKELNNEAYTSALRNEAAGLAKGLLTSVGGADVVKLGEVANNAVGIGQTAADQVIGHKGLSDALGNAQMDRWTQATKAGDSLDVQILILQARELAKKAKNLDKDMQKMKDWYDNEKPGNTDSSKVDQMAIDLIENNPDLAIDPVLAADMTSTPTSKPTDPPVDRSDPKSGVGLDFLKEYDSNVYGKKISFYADLAPSSASIYDNASDQQLRSIDNLHKQWDYGLRDDFDLDVEMTFNKDNTITGKMVGSEYIYNNFYNVNFTVEGKYNPKDNTFEGKIIGTLVDNSGNSYTVDSYKQKLIKRFSEFKNMEATIKNVQEEDFTFKGVINQKNRQVDGFFSFYHWHIMEGDY